MSNGIQQYVTLENRLVLLAWLNSLLGYRSSRELLADTKGMAEGFGADGRSFLYHHLIARASQLTIPADDLARYEENIRRQPVADQGLPRYLGTGHPPVPHLSARPAALGPLTAHPEFKQLFLLSGG